MAAASGPGYLAAVGYMDPGKRGRRPRRRSAFGDRPLGVVVLANVMAMAWQWLAARAESANGTDLAPACRAQ
jgi:manganese transport protein